MPAISSSCFVLHRRHPSRLFDPSDSLRSAWTGPGGDAQQPFPHRRKWQAWSGQPAPSCRLPLVGTQHGNWNRPGLWKRPRWWQDEGARKGESSNLLCGTASQPNPRS